MRVLLLPGLDGSGELFAPLCAAFSKKFANQVHFEVVRYQDEIRFDDYVDFVWARLPSRDAVVIAESFSGPIALALIARDPSRFRCAVLCATFAVSPYSALTRLAQFAPTALFAPNWIGKMAIRHRCLDGNASPELVIATNDVLASLPAHRLKSRLKVLADMDVRSLLPRVTVPVLYLQAAQDRIVSGRLSRELSDYLPQVEVKLIDGPHFLLQSRPQKCAQEIEAFFAAHSIAP